MRTQIYKALLLALKCYRHIRIFLLPHPKTIVHKNLYNTQMISYRVLGCSPIVANFAASETRLTAAFSALLCYNHCYAYDISYVREAKYLKF